MKFKLGFFKNKCFKCQVKYFIEYYLVQLFEYSPFEGIFLVSKPYESQNLISELCASYENINSI